MKMLFKIILSVILLTTFLSSCKKDNSTELEGEYLIHSILYEESGGGASIVTYYTYDDSNRLIGSGSDSTGSNFNTTYTYNQNNLIIKELPGTEYEKITEGILNEWGSFLYSAQQIDASDTAKIYSYYTYDNDDMLLECINTHSNGSDTVRYEIVNGNILSYTLSNSTSDVVYKITNQLYTDKRGQYHRPEDKFYYGKRSVSLAKSFSSDILSPTPHHSHDYEYMYSFDDNGNIAIWHNAIGPIPAKISYTYIYQ